MKKDELHKKFGVTPEYLEEQAAEYESSSWDAMKFGAIIQGRPKISEEPLKTLTVRVPESRLIAIKNAAAKKGISRSDFLRQAIDNELISTG